MGFKAKFWLEKDGELIFSSGREDLLRLIRDLGSLNRAAKALSMSYRAAWGKIRATEQKLGWKLVNVTGRRKHMTLTQEAMDLLERFGSFEKEANKLIERLYSKKFPDGP
jgi:molybdate transport system regulatory protein